MNKTEMWEIPLISHKGPLPIFTFVRDLEVFEGPLLSELRGEDGSVFLESWCDRNKDLNRTFVVQSSRQEISEYLKGMVTRRNVLFGSGKAVGYLLEYRKCEVARTLPVKIATLPEDYFPDKTVRHDPELRPPGFVDWSA